MCQLEKLHTNINAHHLLCRSADNVIGLHDGQSHDNIFRARKPEQKKQRSPVANIRRLISQGEFNGQAEGQDLRTTASSVEISEAISCA
jgi:hypothetical protein